jgi:hypothetical protein
MTFSRAAFLAVLAAGAAGRLAADAAVAALWQAAIGERARKCEGGGGGGSCACRHGAARRAPEREALVAAAAAPKAAPLRTPTPLSEPLPPPLALSGGDGAGAGEPAGLWLRRAAFLWSTTMPKATLQASLAPKVGAELVALGAAQATANFITESAAVAILVAALAGSVLTWTIGRAAAQVLEAADAPRVAAVARAEGRSPDAGFSAELEALLRGEPAAVATAVPPQLPPHSMPLPPPPRADAAESSAPFTRGGSAGWGFAPADDAFAEAEGAATAEARVKASIAGDVRTRQVFVPLLKSRSQVW